MAKKPDKEGKAKIGRPTTYTEQKAADFCGRIADGNSMVRVCMSEDMPDKATVFRWLAIHESFRDSYARACAERREVRKEQLLDIPERDDIDPQRLRLLSDNIKWVLAKEEPKKYGDKVQQEISGPDGSAVKFENVSDEELKRRLAEKVAALGVKLPDNG